MDVIMMIMMNGFRVFDNFYKKVKKILYKYIIYTYNIYL